ncbi:MAG: NAD(P)-dependent oxidoreductase [Lachnospiraceae bacterium]|nr:NAD(P)-dependent oxidoreductase [Lachnospiraceae bacterium]
MPQYIVTGASGFVGRNLVLKLAENKENVVYAVVRGERSETSVFRHLHNVKILFCELKDIENLYSILKEEKIKSFFHLAWEGSTGAARADYELQMNNVVYTMKAFDVAKKLKCEKFLCAGTISEHVTDQIHKLKTVSQNMIYALAKRMTYDLLDVVSRGDDLKLVWMRFSNIYGPGNTSGNLISYTFKELAEGNIPQFGTGRQPYNFIYIDDLIHAICCLEEAELMGNCYFLGSGEVMPLKEYLTQIPAILGIDCEMGIGKRPDDGLEFKEEWFDIADLKKETSFRARYTFAQGIRAAFEADKLQRAAEEGQL